MLVKEKLPLIFGVPDKSFYRRLDAKRVFVAELRPDLAGMTIVANELIKRNIEPVVICDNMPAFCMSRGLVEKVFIFYSTLEKKSAVCRTGSLIAAICARYHGLPVELGRGAVYPRKTSDMHKIKNMSVTLKTIKTYAPLTEDVPLSLVEKTQKS